MDRQLSSATSVSEVADAGALDSPSKPSNGRRRLILALPLLAAAGLFGVFAFQLGRDPSVIPSALIGKPVPEFSLAPVKGRTDGLSSANLKGQLSLVNVFASWCVACREEHPFLMRLAASKTVPIYGLNYKDAPDDAEAWLDTNGDPYSRTGADVSGRVAIDWGVYGVPETFVVDANGLIVFKVIGPLSSEIFARSIAPLLGTPGSAAAAGGDA